jgi:hypothetical protein
MATNDSVRVEFESQKRVAGTGQHTVKSPTTFAPRLVAAPFGMLLPEIHQAPRVPPLDDPSPTSTPARATALTPRPDRRAKRLPR